MTQLQPLSSKVDEARATLTKGLPWSPLDYIPGLNRDADRQSFAEQMTRPLAEENDLRYTGKLSDDSEVAVLAERLPWDSDFFGYGVARLNGIFPLEAPCHRLDADYSGILEAFCEALRQRGIRYLFAQVDPRDLALLRALGEQRFTLLETRLHYHFSVQAVHYIRRPDHLPENWLQFREATPDDIPSLVEVAREMVNPYDRFNADPSIHRDEVDRLMQQWVEQSVLGRFADLTIVPDVPEPKALITYRYHKDQWERWGINLVQVVLSAVSAEFLGWFAVVGPEVNNFLRTQGAQHCFGKTQIVLGLDSVTQFGKGEHVFRKLL